MQGIVHGRIAHLRPVSIRDIVGGVLGINAEVSRGRNSVHVRAHKDKLPVKTLLLPSNHLANFTSLVMDAAVFKTISDNRNQHLVRPLIRRRKFLPVADAVDGDAHGVVECRRAAGGIILRGERLDGADVPVVVEHFIFVVK